MLKRKITTNVRLVIAIVPAIAFLASCGEIKKDEEEDKAGELAGTWNTACIAKTNRDNEIESHTKTQTVISGTAYAATMNEYAAADTTCTGAALYTIEAGATFVVGEATTTPAGAKKIDHTPTKFMVTLKNAESVTQFNEGEFCGFSDWAINVAKDVLTAVCGNGDEKNNAVSYDIYAVEGTTLKFGDTDSEANDGSTAEKRPIALSAKDEVYTKQ